MRAVWYEREGAASEVLTVGTMDDPAPGHGEVVVKLAASGVNPSDVKARAGGRGPLAYPKIIPHSDGAGEIVAVGGGVPHSRIGQQVYVWNGQWERPFGTCAEMIAVPADQATPLPETMDPLAGACVGIPIMTAHRCVFADGSVADQTVLVTGGAGAVGHYAIQFAKWGGAKVITTVSGDDKAAHAAAAGADHVINYRSDDVAASVRDLTGGAGVDRIVEVEFGGNLAVSAAALKRNGVIATYGSMADREPAIPFYPLMFNGTMIRTVLVYILPREARWEAMNGIARAQADGALLHAVSQSYPLDKTAEAHEAVESAKVIGNVVVTMG